MRAPVPAVGDGALGFWGALREVFPDTREQWCWFHKIANVLAALLKSTHPGAKKALAEIWKAEDKAHALDAVKAFETAYGAKFPKAVAKITDDVQQLLAFYDFPAEHLGAFAYHESDRNLLSRRCATAARSPRAPARGQRVSPWPTS
jgi:transposase-like protein